MLGWFGIVIFQGDTEAIEHMVVGQNWGALAW
jgi:hypothetical protein